MVSAIYPATVAGDARVVPGVGSDRCGLRSASESVFHSVLLLRPEWVGEPASAGYGGIGSSGGLPDCTGLSLSNNISWGGRGDGGRVRVCAYESASSHIRAGRPACGAVCGGRGAPGAMRVLGGRGRCARERGGRGQGRPRSGGAPRIRAYGTLARDAKPARRPSSEAGALPAAEPWPCADAPPACSKPITSAAASTATCTCRNSAPLEDHFKNVSAASQNEDQQAA
jgi:hypothetical protein